MLPPDPADPPVRKLYRSSEGRMVGGVARGLAGHLALPVSWVRVVFVVLATIHGLGILLYAIFWFVVPLGVGGVDEAKEPRDARHRGWPAGGRARDRSSRCSRSRSASGSCSGNLSLGAANAYVWPLLLIGLGVALVWRQADNARRAHWVEVSRGRSCCRLCAAPSGWCWSRPG